MHPPHSFTPPPHPHELNSLAHLILHHLIFIPLCKRHSSNCLHIILNKKENFRCDDESLISLWVCVCNLGSVKRDRIDMKHSDGNWCGSTINWTNIFSVNPSEKFVECTFGLWYGNWAFYLFNKLSLIIFFMVRNWRWE